MCVKSYHLYDSSVAWNDKIQTGINHGDDDPRELELENLKNMNELDVRTRNGIMFSSGVN